MKARRFARQNTAGQRIGIIDRAIASGAKSLAELQKILRENGYSASHATISRDLLTLQEWGGNWERTSDFKYFYPVPKNAINHYKKSKEQVEKLTQNLVESLKESPFYDDSFATVYRTTRRNDLSDRIIFLGQPMAKFPPETWETVKQAISENRIISFEYRARSAKDGEFHRHTVQPYQLIYDAGNWNLYGLDFTLNVRAKGVADKRRLFALKDMQHLTLRDKDDAFTLPPDFDYRERVIGTFGCYTDKKAATYTIHFSGYAAAFVRDKIWAHDQVITPDPDHAGEIDITFTSNQSKPILNWIMQWSPDAYPIAPAELVTAWKARVQATWERMREMD